MQTLFYDSDKFIKSLQLYEQIISIVPDNSKALLGKANSLANLGRTDDALWYYNEALEIDPTNVRILEQKDNIAKEKFVESINLLIVLTVASSTISIFSFIWKIKSRKQLQKLNQQIEQILKKLEKESS